MTAVNQWEAEDLYAAYAQHRGQAWTLPGLRETLALPGVPEFESIPVTVHRALSRTRRMATADAAREAHSARYDAVVNVLCDALWQATVTGVSVRIRLSPAYVEALQAFRLYFHGDTQRLAAIMNPATAQMCPITCHADGTAEVQL